MKAVIEIILQTLLAFFAILFLTRIIGKKQIAELTFYDYINGITFGSIAATLATDINQRTWQHLLGLFLFAILTYLMQFAALKNRTVNKVLEGEPVILVHEGKILEKNMAKTRFNMGDLLSELRENGIFNLENCHFAILETDGKLSVLPNADQKPLTPNDLNLNGTEESICTELIVDGKIIKDNLSQHNFNEEWLLNKLKENNIFKLEDVSLTIYNPVSKKLYFDLGDDKLRKDTVDISDINNNNK